MPAGILYSGAGILKGLQSGGSGLVNSIDGLQLSYNSANAINVTAGQCYVDSASSNIILPTTTVAVSVGTNANTWYYVYIGNTGTIYTSTSIPAIAAGTGRLVGGTGLTDRCVGAVRNSSAGNVIPFSHRRSDDSYRVNAQTDFTPWQIVNNMTANALNDISSNIVVPAGASAVILEPEITMSISGSESVILYFGNSEFTPNIGMGTDRLTYTISLDFGSDGSTTINHNNTVPIPDSHTLYIYYYLSGLPPISLLINQLGWYGPGM